MLAHYNYYPPSGAVLDQNEPRAYWNGRAWMEPDKRSPAASTTVSRPQTQMVTRPATQTQTPAIRPAKEKCMTQPQKAPSVLEYLIKHPVAPLAGALLVLGTKLIEEPAPPTIPDDLPENTQKQWQMIYSQNLDRFRRRMELWENVGGMLLGYADGNAVLAALPSVKKPA